MNVESLIIFIDIVETGSMGQTAQRLHISQPALTQQIKAMESRLNARLLDRSNKGVRPTAAGERVYRAAIDICESYKAMQADLDSMQKKRRTLRIAATNLVYTYALPCTLFDLKEKFPGFHLDIELFPSEQAERRVIGGKADIGFIVGMPREQKLVGKPVITNRICLVAGSNFAFHHALSIPELYDLPLLLLADAHRSRQLLDAALLSMGVDPARLQVQYSFDSTESIRQSAIRGFGLAFLPYAAVKKDLYSGHLHIVELEGFSLSSACCLIANSALLNEDEDISRLVAYLEKTLEDTVC